MKKTDKCTKDSCVLTDIITLAALAAATAAVAYGTFRLLQKQSQDNGSGKLLRVNYKFSREF